MRKFHFHWNVLWFLIKKWSNVVYFRTNRKHDVKNMINNKVNYTINQKLKAIFYCACFCAFSLSQTFQTFFFGSQRRDERKKGFYKRECNFVSVFIHLTFVSVHSSIRRSTQWKQTVIKCKQWLLSCSRRLYRAFILLERLDKLFSIWKWSVLSFLHNGKSYRVIQKPYKSFEFIELKT